MPFARTQRGQLQREQCRAGLKVRSRSRHLLPILPKFACLDGYPFCDPSQILPCHPSLLRYRVDDHASAFSRRHFTHHLLPIHELNFPFFLFFSSFFLKKISPPEIDKNVPGSCCWCMCVCVCVCVCVLGRGYVCLCFMCLPW